MDPFLKWAGGKRWLIPKLRDRMPSFQTYYEPFLGSGGLFFALEPQRAVLSDCNPELMNCYKVIKTHCQSVIRILKKLNVNKKTYYRVRDVLYTKADPIERAAFFIFLNKTCWNGLYRVNRQGRFNVPVGRATPASEVFDEEELLAASRLLKRTILKCCDFEEAVKEANAGDLVYFDPPYITTHLNNGFIKYNSKLFRSSDELRLAKLANSLSMQQVSVVVSNAAHPFIKQLYDGPFYKLEITRSSLIAADARRRKKFGELLLSNFPIELAGRD
jgi:DNA adenine methylase